MALLAVALVVAFLGGVFAFAMPCCFSVLLPTYFGSAFRSRTRILGMTAIFAAGIATIMLPIAMGASALAQALNLQHRALFAGAGFLMILVGMLTLWGRSILPQFRLPVDLKRSDPANVYALGAFSGVASSCCAPVLAGLAVLTALSESWVGSLLVGLAYVLGMVMPLLLAALWSDRPDSLANRLLHGRTLHLRIGRRDLAVHSSKLLAGVLFIGMGIVTVALGVAGAMIAAPGVERLALWQARLENTLDAWGTTFWGAALLWGILGLIVLGPAWLLWTARRRRRSMQAPAQPE